MLHKSLKKALIALAATGAILLFGLPIGLYVVGISNIRGRPEAPRNTDHLVADTDLLHKEFRSSAPFVLRTLNPWAFTATVLARSPQDTRPGNSDRAVWLIVRSYNSEHLKSRKMAAWHLSGAALTIWVSRNWSAEQVVTAAAAIVRSTYPPYDTSALNEVRSLGGLPKELSDVLGAHWNCCGMVDVGAEFQPTDVAGGPERRFVLAGVSKTSALVAYEWGNGWERGLDAAAYVYASPGWRLIARWPLDNWPSSIAELISETSKLPKTINSSHYFDDEPDFAKDIPSGVTH